MGTGPSKSNPEPMITKAGQYRAKWLKKEHEGTARDGYRYSVAHAPSGQAKCRGCGKLIAKGALRIGRTTNNPFDAEGGHSDMTYWYHAQHAFPAFLRSRCTSVVPLRAADIGGIAALSVADRADVTRMLGAFSKAWSKKCLAA